MKPLYAAAGLLERVLLRAAAALLPWSQRSQQDAWRQGYIDGLRDAADRQPASSPRGDA